MSSSCRRQSARRVAALRHRRRRSPRCRLAAHPLECRSAAAPSAAPSARRRRRRAPGPLSLDALDAWAASLNASTPNYNGTRWLAKCLRWHAYDYATCGVEKESADERFVVCAGAGWDGGARYIEPRQRGGVAGPLLPSSELPGWWLEQLDGLPGGAMIAARLGGLFDCAAFAEAQRKVCVCSTETPAVTASARAVAANGAEPLGCVSEAVGSETDPIAGNRINDERNVQRRLESLGFDAGAGTSDPGTLAGCCSAPPPASTTSSSRATSASRRAPSTPPSAPPTA